MLSQLLQARELEYRQLTVSWNQDDSKDRHGPTARNKGCRLPCWQCPMCSLLIPQPRLLQEEDVEAIRARTAESSAFGFLSVDVDITWEEVSRPT